MVLNQTTVLAWIIHTALIVKCLKLKYTTLKGTHLTSALHAMLSVSTG